MTLRSCALRFAVLSTLLLSPLLHAAPMDDRIPQDALLYAGWQGADALAPQYANSNLKGIIDVSGFPAYFAQQLPKWIDLAGQKDPDAPAHIQAAMTGLAILWHHPTALYVGPVDFTNPKEPQFRAALLCDAGADASALVTLLQLALAQSPPPPSAHLAVTNNNGLVLVTVGLSTPDQFQVHADALRSSAPYVHALQQVGGSDGAVTLYKNSHEIITMIDHAVDADTTAKPEDRQKYHAVVDALGLEAFTQSAYRGSFKDKGWTDDVFIGTQGPHTGLLTLFDGAPIDKAILALVPQEALSFSAGRFDPSKILPLVRDVAARIAPNALATINKGLVQAQQQLGFDIETDLIAPLGDAWIFYRSLSPDGVGVANTLVHKLKDGDTFAKTLTAVEAQINEKGGGRVQVEPTDADGFQVSALQTPVFSIAWTVRNGYFYLSTLGNISAAINQVEKHQPDVTTNATYTAARATLPNVDATAIEFAEPAKLYPEGYRSLAGVLPMLRLAKIDIPLRILPTPAKAAPFLTPSVNVSWSDAEGYHFTSRAAFPGSAMNNRSDGKTPSLASAAGTLSH
jgi:hypothetical protein